MKFYTQRFHLIFPPMVSKRELAFGFKLLKVWLIIEDRDE